MDGKYGIEVDEFVELGAPCCGEERQRRCLVHCIPSGSILRYKVSKFKTDSQIVKWIKNQVNTALSHSACCYLGRRRFVHKVSPQGRFGNGIAFFRAIVQTQLFKKLSQGLLILSLIQVFATASTFSFDVNAQLIFQMFVQNTLHSNSPEHVSVFEKGGGSIEVCENEV